MKAILFAAAALGQAGCYVALRLLGNLRLHVPETLCIFGGAFLLYILMLGLLPLNTPHKPNTASGKSFLLRNRLLLAVLGLAVLYRGILWPTVPSLSDDIYRYIWEGRVVSESLNPFALAPDSPALAHLRDATIFPLVTRPNLTTIYPPLAQFIFATASSLSYSISSMKAVFILFDLGIIAVLLLTLSALGMSPLRAAVYALNPLVIVEFSGSGHLDSAGIFFMMLALYLCMNRTRLWSEAALSLAFLVKLMPVLLIPVIIHKKKLLGSTLFAVIAAMAFLPFIDAGRQIYATLGIFSEHWMFNGFIYTLLMQGIKNNQTTRRVAAALFCLCAAGLYFRYFNKSEPDRAENIFSQSLMILGLLMLFTPVLHPWYVCWLVPFLAIVQNRAWLVFSGLVFASYWVLHEFVATGKWLLPTAVLLLEYLPFFALLAYDWAKNIREKIDTPKHV